MLTSLPFRATLSIPLFLSLSLSFSLSHTLSLKKRPRGKQSVPLSHYLSLSLSIYLTPSLSLSLSIDLTPSLSLSLFLSLSFLHPEQSRKSQTVLVMRGVLRALAPACVPLSSLTAWQQAGSSPSAPVASLAHTLTHTQHTRAV